MPVAPALEPAERIWSFPDYPSATFDSGAWGDVKFELSSNLNGTSLSLRFVLITEDEIQLWRDHYKIQQETYSFPLPASAWAGYDMNDASMLFPIAAEWFYAGELDEEPVAPGLYNLTVNMVSSPAST